MGDKTNVEDRALVNVEANMSSLILVGNGPSVMDHEFGGVVDSFDIVVRFNWYHIKGFEKQVGAKTNIWFTTVFDAVRMREKYDAIYEHSWEWNPRADKTYKKFKGHESVDLLYKTKRQMVYDMDNYMRMKAGQPKRLDHHVDYLAWSTGAIAAWWFTSQSLDKKYRPRERYTQDVPPPECDQITLLGFDWWDLESNDKHHLGDRQTLGRNHRPKTELTFWRHLAEDGKVIDLNPDSRITPKQDE
jgi:hypothetical protein